MWLIWGVEVHFHVPLNSSLKPIYYWNFPILYIWTHTHWKTKMSFGLSLQMLIPKGQAKRRVRHVQGGLWWIRSGVMLSGRLFSPVCICSGLPSRQYLTRLPSSSHPVGWAEGARECHMIPLCVWYTTITHAYSQGHGLWQMISDYRVNGTFQGPYFCVKYYMVWQQDKRLEIRILSNWERYTESTGNS